MAAAVGTARVTFPMVVVMITPDIGVEVQFACYQCFCCCISVAGNTTIKPDTHIAQCHLRTAANTAADQGIYLQGAQKSCQRTMATAARIHNLIKSDGMPEKLVRKDIWETRYRQICDWERYLSENGFPMVKIFLHLSKDEQKKRLIDRILTQQKNWKFDMSDIEERQYWNRYQKVYGEVLSATSTKYAPWYIVPADDKWYTRYVVAQIVLKELKAINPKFPKLSPEVEKQLARFRQLLKEVDIKDLKSIKNAIDEQKVK